MPKNYKWKIENWPIAKLKPLPNNPRIVKETKFGKLKASIKKNGDFGIITVDNDNYVLSGNQRLKVYEQRGDTHVDVKVPQFQLTEKQRQDIIVSSNEDVGEWDMDILANEFDEDILINWDIWNPEKDMGDIVPANEFVKPREVVCPHCGETITLAN